MKLGLEDRKRAIQLEQDFDLETLAWKLAEAEALLREKEPARAEDGTGMPYLSNETYTRILHAGGCMSNICYNLAQDKKNPHAKSMKEAQEEWDQACTVARVEIKARRLRQKGLEHD